MASTVKSASPKQVRTWARENGHTVGERGKFSQTVIDAFNKAHARKFRYDAGSYVKTTPVEVEGQDARGRRRTRTVAVSQADVRRQAREAGVQVGERGKIPATVLRAAAEGNLASLANTEA